MSEILEKKLNELKKALKTLKDIAKQRESMVVRDSTIKRFEYTFELTWKVLKIYLTEQEGIDIYSPKKVFREARNAEIISDKDLPDYLYMVDDRNSVAHIYGELGAKTVYKNIKKNHIKLIEKILNKIEEDYV